MIVERSVLSVPAATWRMVEKAVTSTADVVFLDLEDSVAPTEKLAGRENVVRAVEELDWGARWIGYRVNALETPLFYRDLIDVVERVGDRVKFIIVPKVHRPEDLYTVDCLLSQIEMAGTIQPGTIRLEAIIESADGLLNVDRIASATPRLDALVFGPGDYTASTRMPSAGIGEADEWDDLYQGHRFHYPMSRILVAARSAGIRAIDGPVANIRDPDRFRRSALIARSLGYDGKWCIHPSQIEMANEVFTPTEQEVTWARRVMDAYTSALTSGTGAITLDNKMIDMASIKMAEVTLSLAGRREGE